MVAAGDVAIGPYRQRCPNILRLIVTRTRVNITPASEVSIGIYEGFFLVIDQDKLVCVHKADCVFEVAVL